MDLRRIGDWARQRVAARHPASPFVAPAIGRQLRQGEAVGRTARRWLFLLCSRRSRWSGSHALRAAVVVEPGALERELPVLAGDCADLAFAAADGLARVQNRFSLPSGGEVGWGLTRVLMSGLILSFAVVRPRRGRNLHLVEAGLGHSIVPYGDPADAAVSASTALLPHLSHRIRSTS